VPLLRLAKEVVVVAVSEGDRISEAASLGDVVAWLGKHEVKASERESCLPALEGSAAP
jgi:hypothetical protein